MLDLKKQGRYWFYRPPRGEFARLSKAFKTVMPDAYAEWTGGPVSMEFGEPAFLMFGGGAEPTVMIYLVPPKPRLGFVEALLSLFCGRRPNAAGER